MKQEHLTEIIERYRKQAGKAREASLSDKSRELDDFADFVEQNSDVFLEDAYTRESELWEEYENY
ncbi:MAG: hypothetical protein WC377_06265 [Bacteroidales bacterium]|jgi:hypothetical protein|nr:hypothetical protein [Bacteroidales bacterium]MDD2824836.1 hypothetical protein [Bacteroidales bacterium]MDD3100130.1 hypothetical protein [Bacteroidales bacterium]MDD3639269.1 hypothetical protein [Bacteroidales bacterium]MDD3944003.1 hypothetical protein [Bacteroidales bacterium]